MKHLTSLFVILALLWWVLSGFAKPLLLSLGLASVLFTVFIARRMNVVDEESHPMHLSGRLARYWLYLLWQILLSNLQMVRMILSPRPDLDPRILTVTTRQESGLGKVVLGNSVTLTPGTVTIDIRNDQLEIHAINESVARDVEHGAFDSRVPLSIEGDV